MTSSPKLTTPQRFDIVGSFLRPDVLKRARADFADGVIDFDQLTAVEDEAIRDLVAKEKAAGLGVITDGEFRRATWHLDFMWGFDGIGHNKTDQGVPFHDEQAMIDDTYVTGRLSVDHHPFVDHFAFVKALAGEGTVAKQTIPAPANFLFTISIPSVLEQTERVYPDREELIGDIVAGYRKVVAELYDAGCRNLQLDDCSWGICLDKNLRASFGGMDEGRLEETKAELLRINNLLLDGLPSDLVVNTHVCRGNYHSTWGCQGGYDDVAEYLLAQEHVNAFYLEFDDERSGSFEPLAKLAPTGKVVLGLITTKRPELEDKDEVIARIHEAARYVPLDRLYLSPQCGFASCEIGNKLTEEQQWAKVALVRQIAEEVWG